MRARLHCVVIIFQVVVKSHDGDRHRPQFESQTINPYLTNGFSHHYHLDESTFIFRGVRSNFEFLFYF